MAKALVAVLGAAVTAALVIFPANSGTWQALTILSAALTAAAVYLVPNKAVAPVKNQDGLTLVEVLIVLIVVALFLLAVGWRL